MAKKIETAAEAQAATPPAPPPGAPPETAAPEFWIVTCRSGHRRRAGRAFGPEPVTIAAADLDEAALAAIAGDPLLTLQPAPAEVASDSPA